MPTNANVQSIEAIKDFRVSLCKFIESARAALNEADADLQRHGYWLGEDRQRHWQMELTRRTEQAQKAKLALLEKRNRSNAAGGRVSCVDEEKALAAAVRRLEEARHKAASTKRWVRELEEEVFKHKGTLQALTHSLDVDCVVMLATLDRMLEALDRYVALAPPTGIEPDLSGGSSAESVARPPPEEEGTQAPALPDEQDAADGLNESEALNESAEADGSNDRGETGGRKQEPPREDRR